jgi:hypothetical protein
LVEQIRQIKASKRPGVSREFGVTKRLVASIDRGESWAWVGSASQLDNKQIPCQKTIERRAGKKRKEIAWDDDSFNEVQVYIRERVVRSNPSNDACALWNRAKCANGYGIATFKGTKFTAHRLSYIAFSKSTIPVGLVVRHKCTLARHCVNPNHLEIGTHKDNAADQVRDGTRARLQGMRNPNCTVTDETVRKIKLSNGSGTRKERAARFNTTVSIVKHIDDRRSGMHVGI